MITIHEVQTSEASREANLTPFGEDGLFVRKYTNPYELRQQMAARDEEIRSRREEGETLQSIADDMHLSRERIRQIVNYTPKAEFLWEADPEPGTVELERIRS